MLPSSRRTGSLALVAALLFLLALVPAVLGHAALTGTDPADKATVPGPFTGPITLTFSEALQTGSHAELVDGAGSRVADAVASANRLTFTPPAALAPGTYTVQWTSVAADKDVARGTISFTVAQPTPAPPSPTPAPTAAPTVATTASPTGTPAPTAAPSSAASVPPANGSGSSASTSDVLVPIVVALLLVAVVGGTLLRRRAGS